MSTHGQSRPEAWEARGGVETTTRHAFAFPWRLGSIGARVFRRRLSGTGPFDPDRTPGRRETTLGVRWRRHEDHPYASLGDDGREGRVAESGDVVDDLGAGVEGGSGRGWAGCVGGDRDWELRGQGLDRSCESCALLFTGDVGVPVGGGGSGADVDQDGSSFHHGEGGRQEIVGLGMHGARVEGLGTDVENAHDADGKTASEGHTG